MREKKGLQPVGVWECDKLLANVNIESWSNPYAKKIMAKSVGVDSSLDAIAQQLDILAQEELREVLAMVEILLTVKAKQADTADREVPTEPRMYQGPKGGRGHIEEKMIPDHKRSKTYGPYRYLRYWQEGRLKTRYLGKADS